MTIGTSIWSTLGLPLKYSVLASRRYRWPFTNSTSLYGPVPIDGVLVEVTGFPIGSQMCFGTMGRSPPGRILKVGAASRKLSLMFSGSMTSADSKTGYSQTWWL